MTAYFNEIVVGAGAMGGASIYHLRKIRNQNHNPGKSLVLEQFKLLHSYGSSSGESRGTRTAIMEGSEYVPLVQRANILWRELECETKQKPGSLYHLNGDLVISPKTQTRNLEAIQFAADEYKIPHKLLSNAELKKRYPQFNIRSEDIGHTENTMGFLSSDECMKAHIDLAKFYGAEIHEIEIRAFLI